MKRAHLAPSGETELRAGFYREVSDVLRKARARAYRAINSTMVEAYWNVGRLIVEEEQRGSVRAEYAAFLIPKLAMRLTREFGRGFRETNLKYFRQFYLAFSRQEGAEIRHTLCDELSWSHYRLLMRVANPAARAYYVREAAEQGWVVRTLDRQINSFAYERTARGFRSAHTSPLVSQPDRRSPPKPQDLIKDPYILEFLDVKEAPDLQESVLEQAIIGHLQAFMLELGKGFAFVGRQFRVSTETKHFFVDLVFYNYVLKCFVLLDLKTTELTHQDIGQMDMYVRIFEDTVKGADDNPTVGLILCAEKDRTIVKYSVLNESRQLFASKYRPCLPTEEELMVELDRERKLVACDSPVTCDPRFC
jgi:predicted nuclease of restriction endonuclease-like (RecB) superfamily